LKSTAGLNLVDTAYYPHYQDKHAEIVAKLKKKYNYPIKELRDGEAVLVNMDIKKLVAK